MYTLSKRKGFSLIELLVVVSIFLVITSVVLFNQSKFSSDIANSNVAYAIALQIRQAQVYGTLVSSQNATDFSNAYGIHFKNSGGVISFELFADDGTKDNRYTSGETIINTFALNEGNSIVSVCTNNASDCMYPSSGLTDVNIVFKRPDPAAIITNSASPSTLQTQAEIVVQSALGDRQRTIKVFSSGQVSVYNY